MRVWNIGERDLWLDEALSVLYAGLPLDTLVELRRTGTNPPLYHIVLGWWVRAFGDGEEALRMMSAVAGMAAVGLAYPLGCRFGGRRIGLIACALLAANHWAVCYSQETRYYALIEALSMLTTLLLYDALTTGRTGRLIGYAVVSAISVWVHTFAWFVLLAQAVWVVARLRAMPSDNRRRRLIVHAGIAGGAVILLFIPWLPVLADQIRTVSAGYWIPRPGWGSVGEWARGMLAPWPGLRIPTLAACVIAVAWTMFHKSSAGRRAAPRRTGTARLDICYLFLWALIPLVLPVIWSLVGTPVFRPKYAIVTQPAVVLLLALFIARRPTLCCTLYAAFLIVFWPAEAVLIREDWRAAARLVDEQAAKDARIFVYHDYCYFPLRYYLSADRAITPVLQPDKPHSGFADLYPDECVSPARVREAARSGDEVWVVLSHIHRDTEETDHEALIGGHCRNGTSYARHALKEVEVLCLNSAIPTDDELRHSDE